jgi:preprotein translocase subunit SecG
MDQVTTGNPVQNYTTVKIVIFVVIIACILVIVYFLFAYYSCDDDEGFFGGGKSDISVNWNIDDMVAKIHARQASNLSRLSHDAQYNI